jgi:hypothetical protein
MILENMNSEALLESCHKTEQQQQKIPQPSPQHSIAKVTVLLTGNTKGFSKNFCLVCQHCSRLLL